MRAFLSFETGRISIPADSRIFIFSEFDENAEFVQETIVFTSEAVFTIFEFSGIFKFQSKIILTGFLEFGILHVKSGLS